FGVAVGTARSTDDEQLGVRVFDFGQRGDGHVDTLEWLDPADEQQYGTAVVVQAEGALRAATVAGREERVDYPGRHELDALRRHAVQALQLLGLGGARCRDRVRATHHRDFRVDASLKIGRASCRERAEVWVAWMA